MKLEVQDFRVNLLENEEEVYSTLGDGVEGFPRMRWYGEAEDFNVLVMDKLGPSLEDLFQFCGCRFSVQTALLIGRQVVSLYHLLYM